MAKQLYKTLSILLVSILLVTLATPSLAKHSHKKRPKPNHKVLVLKKHVLKKHVKLTTSHHKKAHRKVKIVTAKPVLNFNDFNNHVVNLMHKWEIPGATVAVMKNNNLIMSSGYGWASIEGKQPMKPHNLFRIASVSKAVTAVALLKVLQDKHLSVDTKVFDILNDLKPLENKPVNSQLNAITLRHLLQMSSGWYSLEPGAFDPMFGPWPRSVAAQLPGGTPPDCIDAARMMMSHRFHFKPGAQFSYSNLNYCLAGLVINKLTNTNGAQGYEQFVKQTILAPAGIYTMRLGSTQPRFRAQNEVQYYGNPRAKTPAELANITPGLPYGNSELLRKNYSDGGWIASAADLARFASNLNHILDPRTISQMTAPPTYKIHGASRYFAMGWTVEKINGRHYWIKHGSFTGTIAMLIRRDDGTVFVALFNTAPSSKNRFMNEVKGLLIRDLKWV